MQLGQTSEIEFERYSFARSEPSIADVWPTKENPTSLYKFGSIWLELGQRQTIIERKTYSLLEFLGDVGGLWDGLTLLFDIIIQPIASLKMKA